MKKLFCLLVVASFPLLPLAAAETASSPLDLLTRVLSTARDDSTRLNVLRGMNASLKGKRNLAAPAGWSEVYHRLSQSPQAEVRQEARLLGVIFGGADALADLRKILSGSSSDAAERKQALESLVAARDAQTLPLLLGLVAQPGPLRQAAIHGLSGYEGAEIARALVGAFATLGADERREALAVLAMRPAWARELLAAIDQKKIARADLSTPLARQLQDFKDPEIDAWLSKNFGVVHTSPAEKLKQIAQLKEKLTLQSILRADPSHGRALFSQTCALCHTIFGAGAKIGPELPGAFEDIDYLLLNIIDPNAIIGKDYQQTVIETKSGQTLVGIIGVQDNSSVTLKSLAGLATVQRSDIAKLSVLDISLMPEGLLSALSPDDIRDLFSYLRRHGQAPMLANAANINDFFNGRDLNRWIPSSASHWQVVDGVITGTGSADRAEFLASDFVADNYRFTFALRLTGAGATANIEAPGGLTADPRIPRTLMIGNGSITSVVASEVEPASAAGGQGIKVDYTQWVPCEISVQAGLAKITIAGQSLDSPTPLTTTTPSPGSLRVPFTFKVAGAGAKFEVKDLKLELPN